MSKTVKLADIAERAGVSIVSVSKALAGKKGVSEEMRRRIRDIADELGYKQPSAIAGVTAFEGYSLGVLIHDMYLGKYDSFYLHMYQVLSTRATSRGAVTMLETINDGMIEASVLPKIVEDGRASGIIIIGKTDPDYIEKIRERAHVPLLFLDFCTDNSEADAVISDGFYGAYYMTNYLWDMGHRDIAFVGSINANGSIMDRYLGYLKSMSEHGADTSRLKRYEDRTSDGVVSDSVMKLKKNNLPTAFFCNCDLTAACLIRKLEGMGYKIPEDISVAGFDNYLVPGSCDVAVTSYEIDVRGMADRAVDTIISKIKGEPYAGGVHSISGHMVIKDSVAEL